MKVTVEDVPQVQVGTKGILIRIRDNDGGNLGKLRIGNAKVRWAKGARPERNAVSITVKELVEYLNQIPGA